MNARMIRYTTKPGSADENQRLVEGVLAELAEKSPEGVHYAVFRGDDGVSFVHLLVSEGDDDTLTSLEAFATFQHAIAERWEESPTVTQMSLVGSYRVVDGV